MAVSTPRESFHRPSRRPSHPRPRPSEHELVLAAKAGAPGASTQLLDAFTPLIASVARTYRGSAAVDRRELMQEGCAGLLTALRRYDPERGTPFWAYASWWVRQAMQQLVAELTQPVVLSDRALRQLAHVRSERRAYANMHGAWPTTKQLASATELPLSQIEHLLVVERAPRALDEPRDGSEAPARELGETLTDPAAEEEYDRVLTRIETDRMLTLLAGADARGRAIVRAHYGLDGPEQTLRQIAGGLGISAERVRQLEQQVLEELRCAADG